MAINMGVRTGSMEDQYVLAPGQHAVKIAHVSIREDTNKFKGNEPVTKLIFEFSTLKPAPENDPNKEKAGKHGVISAWVALTDYQVTDKPNSNLTKLINSIFGRQLTEAEAKGLDIERMVGIKGYVLVSTGDNGKPRFAGFILPEGRPAPDPADYQTLPGSTPTAPTPAKAAAGPKPKDDFEEDDIFEEQPARRAASSNGADDDLPDPFA